MIIYYYYDNIVINITNPGRFETAVTKLPDSQLDFPKMANSQLGRA